MKKSDIVYVIGAGFSAEASIPTQKDILRYVEKLDVKDMDVGSGIAPILINKIFLPYIYKKDEEICDSALLEDIYTMLDSSILKNRNIGIFDPKALINVRTALDQCVLKVVQKQLSKKSIDFYKRKLKLILSKKVSFISTNWDSVLEDILIKMGYKINYCFNEGNNINKIPVIKPHGSLNWKYCQNCNQIFFNDSLKNIKECDRCQCNDKGNENKYISYYNSVTRSPLEKKLLPLFTSPTFIKNSFLPYFNIIFKRMLEELSFAKEIVFIGYSLPVSDHDIREVLIRANIVNHKAQIKVVLLEKNRNKQKNLRNNFLSIYDKKRIIFDFEGLSKI